MKVLSLFDGMACGMIAMQIAGVDVESYDAYEIDKYAIKTAQHNFPMIKEHGDVFEADFTKYGGRGLIDRRQPLYLLEHRTDKKPGNRCKRHGLGVVQPVCKSLA